MPPGDATVPSGKMFVLPRGTAFKLAVIRFVRVVGGGGLGAVMLSLLNFVQSGGDLPSAAGSATFGLLILIGAGLNGLDKYFRERGLYGSAT